GPGGEGCGGGHADEINRGRRCSACPGSAGTRRSCRGCQQRQPIATGTSTIIPINVTATDPLGLTNPLLGQLGLTDPLLGQPSSVVPLPDVIVTGGISGTTLAGRWQRALLLYCQRRFTRVGAT